MQLVNNRIIQALESICHLTSSDFSALALMEFNRQYARWKYVVGNRNDRYKQMKLKPGWGPAGLALRIGKPVNWDDRTPNPAIGYECALIVAEQLHFAAAFPITKDDRSVAVLLVARRTTHPYLASDMSTIQDLLYMVTSQIDL